MHNQHFLRRLWSGILFFVMVLQWLSPLQELSDWTDVYAITPILITVAGLSVVDVLRIATFWSWIVKLLIILIAVSSIFHGSSLLQLEWWSQFLALIMQDFFYTLSGQWYEISAEGRTLLFIGAWAIVISWVYAVILYHRAAIYVSMITIVYLLTLQIWVELDTIQGVWMTMVAGLLLHGLSVLPVLEDKFGLRVKHAGWPLSWVISSTLLVCLIMGSGLLLSKGQEKTTLKLTFDNWNWQSIETFTPFNLQSFSRHSAKSTDLAQKSGYSLQDTQLGGSVSSDDTIAFLALTEQPNSYWRGESKAIYNGKGWSNLANDVYHYGIGAELPDILSSSNPSTLNPGIFQQVFPQSGYPYSDNETIIFSQGAIRHMNQVSLKDGITNSTNRILMDGIEGQFILQGSGSSDVASYVVESSVPITSGSSNVLLANGTIDEPIPTVISYPYVQLPVELPERVAELAHSLTDGLDSTWDKANAIDQYLSKNYQYTLTPALTNKEGDFVDQFLFERMEGYCDYFSTAMTVMLRSVGIPARYVKGFSPGEIVNAADYEILQDSFPELHSIKDKIYPIVVRNRDAHSWVEVYISGVGWTSFDPTPGRIPVTEASESSKSSLSISTVIAKLHKYTSNIITVLLDRKTYNVMIGFVALTLIIIVGKSLLQSRHLRAGYEIICIRMLMFRYARGLAKKQSDLKLLERIIQRIFTRYGHNLHHGETLRESVSRVDFPDKVNESLHELLSLYEWARYGPANRKRIPYESLEQPWRLLR